MSVRPSARRYRHVRASWPSRSSAPGGLAGDRSWSSTRRRRRRRRHTSPWRCLSTTAHGRRAACPGVLDVDHLDAGDAEAAQRHLRRDLIDEDARAVRPGPGAARSPWSCNAASAPRGRARGTAAPGSGRSNSAVPTTKTSRRFGAFMARACRARARSSRPAPRAFGAERELGEAHRHADGQGGARSDDRREDAQSFEQLHVAHRVRRRDALGGHVHGGELERSGAGERHGLEVTSEALEADRDRGMERLAARATTRAEQT